MNKLLTLQIVLILVIWGAAGGVVYYLDTYEKVESNIVSVTCLSCIKLDVKTRLNFTFETVNNLPHPDFILENLTKGSIFLEIREDVCAACDEMAPVVKEIFSLEFEKEETFFTTVVLDGANVTFMHINLNHASEELAEAFEVYDRDRVGGVPMFTVISLGYDRGFIRPYYTTAYGTLELDTFEERKDLLLGIISNGIDLYQENHLGYGKS